MSRFTVINCMDGRVQIPVIEFLKKHCRVEYVDVVTEAGPVLLLSEQKDKAAIDYLVRKVNISLDKNKSDGIAIVAHYDCKGNPENKEIQLKQLTKSANLIRISIPLTNIIGLWVNENWEVEEILV